MDNYFDENFMEELKNKQKKFIKSFLNWAEENKSIELKRWHSGDEYLTSDEVDKLITDYINRFKVSNTHG